MKYKIAITVKDYELPFILQVAIPILDRKVRVTEFRFSRFHMAEDLMLEYNQAFQATPLDIANFHYRVIERMKGKGSIFSSEVVDY